jgi:hypothetical protein
VYNPEKEALKYLDSLNISPHTRFFILLECGFGYLIPPLRLRYPAAQIISVHIRSEYTAAHLPDAPTPDAEWSPASTETCTTFLERVIGDSESVHIKLIEWRPAIALDALLYRQLVGELTRFIRRSDANARTTRHFTERWRRNTLRNSRFFADAARKTFPELAAYQSDDLVICAAGPTLEASFPAITAQLNRGNTKLAAAASAVAALRARSFEPDIIFTSDGGSWARLHFFEAVRCLRRSLIVAALHAALPSCLLGFPILFFGDGSAEQRAVLDEYGLPRVELPQRGTVTASALDFALRWTTGQIFLAGASLSSHDLHSHARPYAFDALLVQTANRYKPWYHQQWARTRALEAGGSYKLYAAWFEQQLSLYPPRIFNLGENHPVFTFCHDGSY